MNFKNLCTALLMVSASALFSQATWNNTSFVHRDGRLIKDGNENILQLEGVNLGGWLMWEGWIWNGGFTPQKVIHNTIASELGTAAANDFRDSIYWNYITEEDIAHISQECFNVVRIPFNHYLLEDDFTPYVYKPEGWAVLDSVLSWCEQNNVYAILDLHSAPGGQSNLFTADPDFLINLWNGDINQTRTANLWKAIAERYKDRGIIAGYDLLNEPDPDNETNMLNIYQRIVDSIRTVDNNHMLFIEGSDLSTNFTVFTSLIDPNMAYEFHLYTWFVSDIAAEVQKFTTLSETYDVPVWCGEWGENSYEELDTTLRLFRKPEYGISGSAFWTWKKAQRNSPTPAYFSSDTTALWNKTIMWIGNKTLPKPTNSEMQIGMDEFIENSKWKNSAINQTLSEILTYCRVLSTDRIITNQSSAFPNPTSGNFEISLDKYYDSILVKVRNINGQLIDSEIFSNSEIVSISLNGNPGVYLIELISEDSRSVIKMIKQ